MAATSSTGCPPSASAAVDAGSEKIHAEAAGAWDGQWTTCVYTFTSADRRRRDRIRDLLAVEGFAQLAREVMVHVRDKNARILAAIATERRVAPVTLWCGATLVGGDPVVGGEGRPTLELMPATLAHGDAVVRYPGAEALVPLP